MSPSSTSVISPWLTGQLLVAMPNMSDQRFSHSVIFMCSHSPEGAMGLIVNRLYDDIDFSTLLNQLEIKPDPEVTPQRIHFGGPVENSRGFILHPASYVRDGTVMIDDRFAMTATMEIVKELAAGEGPDQCLVALGYSGWGPGQLEAEMQHNGWLTVPADEDLLFGFDLKTKWERAIGKLGIHPGMLSDEAGHA